MFFIEPTITWVPLGFAGYIWLDTKIVLKMAIAMYTPINPDCGWQGIGKSIDLLVHPRTIVSHIHCVFFAVMTCGWLNIPYAVRPQSVSYTIGSNVTVDKCMEGYDMYGRPTTYFCVSIGNDSSPTWTPPVSNLCKSTN